MSCPDGATIAMLRRALTNSGDAVNAVSCVYFLPLGKAAVMLLVAATVGMGLTAYNRGIAGVAALAIMLGPVLFDPLPGVAIGFVSVLISLLGLVVGAGFYIFLEEQGTI